MEGSSSIAVPRQASKSSEKLRFRSHNTTQHNTAQHSTAQHSASHSPSGGPRISAGPPISTPNSAEAHLDLTRRVPSQAAASPPMTSTCSVWCIQSIFSRRPIGIASQEHANDNRDRAIRAPPSNAALPLPSVTTNHCTDTRIRGAGFLGRDLMRLARAPCCVRRAARVACLDG